ncbi:MAG: PIN domain-containing protein, partial [Chloroflexota bacterium]|nr:PIN domain-containing protein [Chloroflexota bacterium]
LARYVLGDIPDHSARSSELFRSASRGAVDLFIPATVFVELAHLLHRRLSIPRSRVADTLLDVLRIRGIHAENGKAISSALDFWRSTGGLSFPDCYHLALTRELGMTEISSFDKKMGRYPGVTRIEP